MRWYIGAVGALVVLHVVGVLRPVTEALTRVTDPLVHGGYHMVGAIHQAVWNWRVSVDEKLTLSDVLRERDILKARVALVEAENASLRRQLNFLSASHWTVLGADVIAKSTDVSEQTLIINRGVQDGVMVHAIVMTDNGVMVGEIITTEATRATVRLLNDRQSRVGALLSRTARPIGIVEGGYGLGIRLTLIPPEEVVSDGDLIVTNDTTEFMPRGLIVGTVASVGRETYEPFQHALLRQPVPYEAIQTVEVILKK